MPNKNYYGTIADVRLFSGVKKESLKLATEAELDVLIEKFMYQVRDLINQYCGKDFALTSVYFPTTGNVQTDNVPPGIHNLGIRATRNMIAQLLVNRESNVKKVNGDVVGILSGAVLSQDIRDELDGYKKSNSQRKGSYPFFA